METIIQLLWDYVQKHPELFIGLLAGWLAKLLKDRGMAWVVIRSVNNIVDEAIKEGINKKYKWIDILNLILDKLEEKQKSPFIKATKVMIPANLKNQLENNPKMLIDQIVSERNDIIPTDYDFLKP